MTAKVIYNLKTPVVLTATETVTEIEFTPPTGRDLREMPLDMKTMDEILKLAARCSGKPAALFDKLDVADVMGVAEVVGGFFPESPRTGKK